MVNMNKILDVFSGFIAIVAFVILILERITVFVSSQVLIRFLLSKNKVVHFKKYWFNLIVYPIY